MLPRLTILQVGDLHFPQAARAPRPIDDKDASFSVELKSMISASPIKMVFRRMYQLLDSGNLDAILFMGDLTDIGDVGHYESAVRYIAGALQLGGDDVSPQHRAGIVPGNHDVNRDLAKQPGLATKFAPLNEILHKHGLPQLPIEGCISKRLSSGRAELNLLLLNSCWGCGAQDYIPEQFRKVIYTAIDKKLDEAEGQLLRAYYDYQLDTPAFSEASLEEVNSHLHGRGGEELIVIVAHHNLLPQRMTRLAPYTELVNSGALRSLLAEAKRPVVYLHGHIHQELVEVVSVPDGDNVVMISAPAAQDGFNLIEFVFTPLGVPLTCEIVPWRIDQSGALREQEARRVSLIGRRRRSHSRGLRQLYVHLLDVGEHYWSDLIHECAGILGNEPETTLQEYLELLRSDGTVDIVNYRSATQSWIIRANI